MLEFSFHALKQRFVLFRRNPVFLQQKFFKTRNGIAFAPVLKNRLGHIPRGIVDGMSFHAHHLRLDERRPLAAPRSLACFESGVINLASISAVDDNSLHAIPDGAFRQVFHRELQLGWRGIGPEIVFHDQHQPQFLHGGKIDALISDAGRLSHRRCKSSPRYRAPVDARPAPLPPSLGSNLRAWKLAPPRFASRDRQSAKMNPCPWWGNLPSPCTAS